ncbi:hypothetical protein Psed_6444 [Pseudonocardia dioxanivorans CB1190]|jgi:hypothetical protein|uniref:Uncharacterized protein n=1 Tax=Pseudonocardia dioxanivorans (strain ATCC 55486 / DSM 44775 / JCM 13855 / CB1190) TaxID=675635 RepID=F4CTN2_PSEUX|nr:hypothetical protein Psed_6444 [Pseudonocardia dioxanivorans CB1190]
MAGVIGVVVAVPAPGSYPNSDTHPREDDDV